MAVDRRAKVWAGGAAAALLIGFAGGPAAAEQQIGAAAVVVNSVTGTLAATRQRALLRAGIDVFQNETIDTADNSASRVVFEDRTELSIGPLSQVALDRFVFDPNPAASAVAVSIVKGVARFSTGLLPKPDYVIRTPSCVIGVRGTVLTAIVSPEQASSIAVQEGAATVSAQGVTVTVNAGQTSYVPFGRPPSQPFASPASAPIPTLQMDALLQSAAPAYPPGGPTPGGPAPAGYPPGGDYPPPGNDYPPPGYGGPGYGGGFGFGGGFGGGRGGDHGGRGAGGGNYGGGRGR
jgi:hypothetical protein